MRGYRRRRHRAPWSRRRKRCCVLLVCLVLVVGVILRLDSKLRPAILEIALSDLETVVNNTIDQVCIKDAADGEIAYSKLVQLQYDQNGKLQGLTTDMAALNVLRADMTVPSARRWGRWRNSPSRCPWALPGASRCSLTWAPTSQCRC